MTIPCQKLGVKNSMLLRSSIAIDPVLFKPFFFLLKVCQLIPLYAENVYDQQLMGFKRSHLKIQDPFELNQNVTALFTLSFTPISI